MTIYEIDQKLEYLLQGKVNELTGEVEVDFNEIDELVMERDKKIENLLLYAKNLDALAKGIKEEKDVLTARLESVNKKYENIMRYAQELLRGAKFTTPRVQVSYRNSESVVLDDTFVEYAKKYYPTLLKEKHEFQPDKAEIKKYINAGHDVPYARIQKKVSMSIK